MIEIGELSKKGIQKKLQVGNIDGRDVLEISTGDNSSTTGWLAGAMSRSTQQWVGSGKANRLSVIEHIQKINEKVRIHLWEINQEIKRIEDKDKLIEKYTYLNETGNKLIAAKEGIKSLQTIYSSDQESCQLLDRIIKQFDYLFYNFLDLSFRRIRNRVEKIQIVNDGEFECKVNRYDCLLEESPEFERSLNKIKINIVNFVTEGNFFLQVLENDEMRQLAARRSNQLDKCRSEFDVLSILLKINKDVEYFVNKIFSESRLFFKIDVDNKITKYKSLDGIFICDFKDYLSSQKNVEAFFIYLTLINNSKIQHAAQLVQSMRRLDRPNGMKNAGSSLNLMIIAVQRIKGCT